MRRIHRFAVVVIVRQVISQMCFQVPCVRAPRPRARVRPIYEGESVSHSLPLLLVPHVEIRSASALCALSDHVCLSDGTTFIDFCVTALVVINKCTRFRDPQLTGFPHLTDPCSQP